jgi:hypothetical protein
MGELLKKFRRTKTVTLTVDIVGPYAAGDAVDGLQEITNFLRGADQSGFIEQVVVIDADNQSAGLDLFVFQESVTGGTDQAAYDPGEAEIKNCVGVISVVAGDYASTVNRGVATVKPNFHMQLNSSRSLFFQVVARTTPTFTGADNLQIKFIVNQD